MTTSRRPWMELNPRIAGLLRPALGPAGDAVIVEIAAELPALGGDLSGEYGRALRRGIDLALGRLLDLFGTGDPALDPRLVELYEAFGASSTSGEMALG